MIPFRESRPLAKRHGMFHPVRRGLSSVWNRRASVAVVGYGWHADSEAAMKRVFLGLTSLVFCGVLVFAVNPVRAEQLRLELNMGNAVTLPEHEGIHAARVDMPSVIDMSHASPDRWGTLPPPVDLFQRLRAPAPPLDEYDIPESMFGTISVAAN